MRAEESFHSLSGSLLFNVFPLIFHDSLCYLLFPATASCFFARFFFVFSCVYLFCDNACMQMFF